MSKSEIRKRIIAQRDALDSAVRRDLSARITPRLLALPAYRDARCVMAYVAFGAEFDTAAFIGDLLARGKRLVLPRIERESRTLKLHSVSDLDAELAPGVWGIREPRPDVCPPVTLSEVHFVLVPGLAFTARCERLGYGGGYYDHLIRQFAGGPALAAAAFALQVVPELPMTPTDEKVDLVVTEDAQYHRSPA